MNWPDEEFEAFLRQFRPSTPKPLPTYRRPLVALGAAAVIIAAVVFPMKYGLKVPTTNGSTPPAPTEAVGPALGGGRQESGPSEIQSAPAIDRLPPSVSSTGAGSISPTPSARRAPKGPDSPQRASASATASNDQRLRVGGAVKPPTKIFDVKPVYPEDAQAAGVEGVVMLGAVIGEDGSVIETWVLRSIPELDQAALDAVSQWQFEPTLLNGEPVEVEMTMIVNFTLR